MQIRPFFKKLSLRSTAAGTIFGLVLALGAGHAIADIVNTTYYGCVKQNTGTLRIVSASTSCAANETVISWNQTGPQGLTGPRGPAGPAGGGGLGITGIPFYCSDCYLTPYADQLRAQHDLTHAQISHSHFPNADLSGVILKDSYLDGNDFLGANLTYADLSNMVMPASENNFGISGGANNFDQADLSSANLSGNFFASNFINANLNSTNISNSQFFYAVFNGADLSSADFSGSEFGVHGSSVDFTGAQHMNTANLSGVTWDDVYCTDGFHPPNSGATCDSHYTPLPPPYPVRW